LCLLSDLGGMPTGILQSNHSRLVKTSMNSFTRLISFCFLLCLSITSADAQVVGDTFRCKGGRTLSVTKRTGIMTTFLYNGKSHTLANTTPYGGNFASYGDTQSPKGTGISFSGSGIAVIINGAVDYSCK
jgi:hypothetical protein